MNRQGMIMTVGIGGKEPESLLSALLKSVRDAHPEVLGLIVSADSRPMADQLQERLQEECQIVVFTVQDENDVDLIFSQIVDIIGQLIEKYGVHPQSLRLDFTSGTKAMSAGAILAAVSTGIENLRYIAGERMHGTVQRGLEKSTPSPPLATWPLTITKPPASTCAGSATRPPWIYSARFPKLLCPNHIKKTRRFSQS